MPLCRQAFAVLTILFCALGSAFTSEALALAKSDILLDIVSNCVDTASLNYCNVCRAPRSDAACAPARECGKSTEVWALNEQYTAIRDLKMCGCPAAFVHGLALPRKPVRGVEDPARPDGIWQFAWDVASGRMNGADIALVVNPRYRRSQDQLHVHLVRLDPGARERLAPHTVGTVRQLHEVWDVAARGALARSLDDYGVLVALDDGGSYRVVITQESPESLFTLWRCD